tara:strand:- start:128 stop:817 length:690 start_codon:yes stop_codon:yes gene_type:complete
MKICVKNLILVFIFFFSNQDIAYGDKYLEVIKLYDLYSQEILDIDQLNSGLEKMKLNNENVKNLISLRKNDIISENDFINGIKKILSEVSNLDDELKENDNENEIDKRDIISHEFQVEITKIHAYVISEFNYGEVWNHTLELADGKITKISFKNAQNIDLLGFSKPKIKFLKDNKFSIRSNVTYLPEPSSPIRYDFKGRFEENEIVGEVIITYTGNDAAGTILLAAETN